MTEANILKREIVDYLNARGWDVWRNNSGKIQQGSRMIYLAPPGKGDVVGRDPTGRYVHIEVKTGDDSLSAKQSDELYAVAQTKYGIAHLATTFEAFEAWYEGRERGTFY